MEPEIHNSMDNIVIKSECINKNSDNLIYLKEFLDKSPDILSEFEKYIQRSLREIYNKNTSENLLYKQFPKLNTPLTIDCTYTISDNNWLAVYSPKKNLIRLSNKAINNDLTILLVHELKHAEQWFDETKFNNYQKHQLFCVYEVLAKIFQCKFLGKGAYFNVSIIDGLKKWINKHYPVYKEKYDKQWPISVNDNTLTDIPASFGITDSVEKQEILKFLSDAIKH